MIGTAVPEQLWGAAALAFALCIPVTQIAQRIDVRRLEDENVWLKPFKFAVSMSIHFATFAVIVHCLPPARQDQTWLIWGAITSVTAGGLEFLYIAFQAARRRRSHFNTQTRIEGLLYSFMAIGAVILLSPAVVVGLGHRPIN